MNEELILFHVNECAEALNDIKQAFADNECEENSLEALFYHAYHHINFAWNSRKCASWEESDKRYNELERFPAVFQEQLGSEPAGGRGEVVVEKD